MGDVRLMWEKGNDEEGAGAEKGGGVKARRGGELGGEGEAVVVRSARVPPCMNRSRR